MKLHYQEVTLNGKTANVFIPTREDIESLQVGDIAPKSLGAPGKVTSIFGRGEDVNGRAYVCYYVAFGENSNLSHSLKEGELDRNVSLCGLFKSAELDQIERQLNAGGFKTIDGTGHSERAIVSATAQTDWFKATCVQTDAPEGDF